MSTRYGSLVRPKIAGIESNANSRSVAPSATSTTNIGVISRRPPCDDRELDAVVLRRGREEPLHQPQEQRRVELVVLVRLALAADLPRR